MTQDPGIDYLLAEVTPGQVVITMNKPEFHSEKQVWTTPGHPCQRARTR
jgi:hypothetical protein